MANKCYTIDDIITCMKKNKDRFGKDFDLNKKVVIEVAEIQSKKIRNTIAGYITRLVKQER